MIYDFVVKKKGYKLFFVESTCDDPRIVEQNIMVSFFFIYLIPQIVKSPQKVLLFKFEFLDMITRYSI